MPSERESKNSKDPFIGYKLILISSFLNGIYPKFFRVYTNKSDSFISRVLSQIEKEGEPPAVKSEPVEIAIAATGKSVVDILELVARTGASLKEVMKIKDNYELSVCSKCGKLFITSKENRSPVCRDCLKSVIIGKGIDKYKFKKVAVGKKGTNSLEIEISIRCLMRVNNAVRSYYRARILSISAVKPANELFESIVWLSGENVVNDSFEVSYRQCVESLGISIISFKRKVFAGILEKERELLDEKTKGIRMPVSDNILDFLYFLYTYTGGSNHSEWRGDQSKCSQSPRARGKSLGLSLPNCPTIQP